MITIKTPLAAKVTVTQPTIAVRYLRDFMRNANFDTKNSFYTVGTSKARWVSVQQMVDWYKATRNIDLNAGWLGRSLNAAQAEGLTVSTSVIKTTAGRNLTVYRNAK